MQLVDAGGLAGGQKARSFRRSVFLKTPHDSEGIYGSDAMAAKVVKLETRANRWIQEMDSLHVSAPLSTVEDVRYVNKEGVTSILRVQVLGNVDLDGDTLRVGSSDGGRTMHVDEEQDQAVVCALARRFHLCPIRQALIRRVVKHTYLRVGALHAGAGASAPSIERQTLAPSDTDWIERVRANGGSVSLI